MPQKSGAEHKGRCTAAVKEMRVQTVYKLLADAYTNQQIFQFASENWDVGSRMAENYIREAREMLAEDCNLTRQAYLAEVLARLRNYEQQASKRGQLQVATNSVRLQAELVDETQGIVTTELENLPAALFNRSAKTTSVSGAGSLHTTWSPPKSRSCRKCCIVS